MLALPRGASRVGRYTYALHVRAALLDSVAAAVLLLNEFVARKALGASVIGITALLMLPTLAQIVNLYWTGSDNRDPRFVFLRVGVPLRLLLLAIPWVGGSIDFILIAALASTTTTILIPAQNAIYQANYAPGERGRMFSRVSALAAVATVAVTTLLGWVYDHDEEAFRWVYPLAGLIAALGAISWSRIHWRWRPDTAASGVAVAAPPAIALVPRPIWSDVGTRAARQLLDPFRAAIRLFAEDRDFLRFELAFMTYGLAYMMLQPVLPIFLVDDLGVDYSQAAQAKGLLFYGMMVACLPIAGRLNDRIGSLRVGAGAFLLLALFPGLLIAANGMGLVYLAYAAFGAAMAGVSLAWTLGPLTLAGARSAERYMGAHVALVAVRGLIGYPLGVLLMRLVSPRLVFVISTILALSAASLMRQLVRRREAGPVDKVRRTVAHTRAAADGKRTDLG